jgi:hypothetical protein
LLLGLIVTVRFAPEPPKTILAFGTRLVFDELALTCRLAAAVSASPTVKAMAELEEFMLTDLSVTSLMLGAAFGGLLAAGIAVVSKRMSSNKRLNVPAVVAPIRRRSAAVVQVPFVS